MADKKQLTSAHPPTPPVELPPDVGSALAVVDLPEPTVVSSEEAQWEIQQQSLTAPSGFEIIRVPIPRELTSLTPLQTALVMKSTRAWGEYDLPFLLYVQLKCKELDLDPIAGDVYAVDGRLSTTDECKIRCGRKSGRIDSMAVSDPIEASHPLTGTKDFYCEAKIKHKDESEAQTYKAWFSEWNNPNNANWQRRPIESLQRKALARLCHRMFPLGADEDEFIPGYYAATGLTGLSVAQSPEGVLRSELLGGVAKPTQEKTL